MSTCSNCGYEGTGNYCAECGKHYEVKRLTVSSLLHEVAHLFTHPDKGFVYTLKELAIHFFPAGSPQVPGANQEVVKALLV